MIEKPDSEKNGG